MSRTLVAILVAALSLTGCTPDSSHGGNGNVAITGGSDNKTTPQWAVKPHTPPADIALVFVHGIFGDTLGTWSNGRTSFFDLIQQDPEMGPKVDMYAFGFTSTMFGQGSLGIDEAANVMFARLQTEGVLNYPAVVFIDHSMGGLVTMQMLLDHHEILSRVPAVVFFSTPQSGAEIANIARHVSKNEALSTMIPGDSNAYIRVLNDRWKALDSAERPRVHCGYEKIDTGPFRIVDWAAATRFCDGPALAISANHIDIVKPDSTSSDSFLVVRQALQPLLNKPFKPKLDTPDFALDNGQPVVTISNPSGKQDVKIRNAGGGSLKYSLDQWPNALYVWPSTAERTLEGGQTDQMQIALVWGTRGDDYTFILRSNASEPLKVHVRIANFDAIQANRDLLAGEALESLTVALNDPAKRGAFARGSSEEATARIAGLTRDVVAKRDPHLQEVGQWVIAAELLAAVNWPEFAMAALRQAQKVDATIFTVPSVGLLAGNVSALSGVHLDGAAAASPDLLEQWTARSRTPFTSDRLLGNASRVSSSMQRFPALRASGLSLEGDIARARGQDDKANQTYKEVATLNKSPLIDRRMQKIDISGRELPIA